MDIIKEIKDVIKNEIEALEKVHSEIDTYGKDFTKAIDYLHNVKGKIAITGVGKSGLVGRKISATLSCLGSPSFFLEGVEALHGDLGMVGMNDCLIAISNSGETKEIITVAQILRDKGITVISITGNEKSSLASISDCHIKIHVNEEAGSFHLTPTSSTTCVMAIGDAIAITLSKLKGYTLEDLAAVHPGGKIGEFLKDRKKIQQTS